MQNLSQNQPLIKETANLIRTSEGKRQFLEALEKVSAKVEIKPPITLDKLMSVFGTTALMIQSSFPIDRVLEVGRITTKDEREVWAEALTNLDKILNNQQLNKNIQLDFFQINSLESFAEELAIRIRVLLMEVVHSSTVLPNQLKIATKTSNWSVICSPILS